MVFYGGKTIAVLTISMILSEKLSRFDDRISKSINFRENDQRTRKLMPATLSISFHLLKQFATPVIRFTIDRIVLKNKYFFQKQKREFNFADELTFNLPEIREI